MNYYNVNEKYKTVVERANKQAEDNGGEVEDFLIEMLEGVEEDLNECLIGMMYEIKNTELNLGAIATMESELKIKKTQAKAKVDRLKTMLASALGGESLTDGIVKTTKAVSKSLKITGDIPSEFMSVEVVPESTREVRDNKAIKEFVIENGGVLSWAEIVEKKSVK